ncbi:MAG: TIR domain-containing protein [Ruminococcaceae bacterium]|nr:TIR domain-containing protein [Oscillospiraceae bacterium]
MAVFKCKMCGGALQLNENLPVGICPYCGSQQTFPKVDDEKKLALFNRANNLRFKSEFDKAAGIYESIVSEFPNEAEAYWGLVLCKYGIEYVDDPAEARKVPTCHRTLPTSIMRDEDFQQACENSDIASRVFYREEAKIIDGIQKKILEIANTEEPYDIFICYKENDDITGTRTEDSSMAQDIYTAFTEMGYKVFYARNSLRKVAGTEYEPYIYSALSSAKVMLAIGTKYEYYDAVWVKNEWSRYLSMMAEDKTKHLIPCFKNMDAYDIPEEFSNMQALDMADMMFFNSLEASVKRVLCLENKSKTSEPPVQNNNTGETATIDTLLKRIFIFLEDGAWNNADEYCEKVLDIDPENAQAYLGKLMVELHVKKQADLKNQPEFFNESSNYQKILRYADVKLKSTIIGYLNEINIRKIEEKRLDERRKNEELKQRKKNVLLAARIDNFIDITVGVMANGTVRVTRKKDKYNTVSWSDIAGVSIGYSHLVGLKTNGTVVANGRNWDGQCNVSGWRNIVSVSAGNYHTVGLTSDGTVVSTGHNSYGQCNITGWKDIVSISAGSWHTLGLKSDGTVTATGDNGFGECNVASWTDIIAISGGFKHTVGLKVDGTVVAVGKNKHGQCNVNSWSNIIAVAAGEEFTIGLKDDGTVVYTGSNESRKCDVSGWKNIIAVSAGHLAFGIKANGTVVATDKYSSGCAVDNWKLF